MPTVAFYISGHGFGHASRQIEIINALTRRAPQVSVAIRTSAARWLFDRTLTRTLEAHHTRTLLIEGACDTGVIQIDSLRLDEAETIRRAAAFYADLTARAQTEAGILRQHDVRLVIADAPPLACAAAAAAGVPSIVVANFTWDWIYAAYREALAFAPGVIETIQAAYSQAEAAWRLPMHGGFTTFRRITDMPFVARHARHGREETCGRLGLPAGERLALSSFGGYGVGGLDLASLDCFDTWHTVVTGQSPLRDVPRGVCFVDEARLYDSGLRYEDLVAAVDVVVTKPGYGIISECVANGTAILYTSRGRFAEYDVLVAEMPRFVRCRYLDRDRLLAGRWRDALDAVVSAPPPPEQPPTNGADVIASMIAGRLTS